jgi:ABC-type multidrug transport system permease subunit
MGNWWRIAKLELLLAAKDKEAVIWSLVAPIAFAWFFGLTFGGGPAPPTRVAIERGDNPGYVESIFAGLLQKKEIEVVDERKAKVVLPDSLMHKILDGEQTDIEIIRGGIGDSRVQQLSMRVREIVYKLTFGAKKSWLETPPDSAAIAGLVLSDGPIFVESLNLGKTPHVASGAEHQLPAMVVMFLLFQLTTFFMVMWVQDVQTGKIKRITMSPTTIRGLFMGQLASRFLWGCLQVLMVGGVGSLILGVRLEVPWAYVAVMLAAYMVTAISLGLLLASFFTSLEKANAVGVITALVLAALGGCWWPLEIVSPIMRTAAMFLPTGLMMGALGDFIAYGKDAAFPAINFLGLLAMSAVFFPVGISRLKKQIIG